MSRRLKALIAIVALASGALFVSAIYSCQIGSAIEVKGMPQGILLGVLFWIGLTMIGSSLAVRMPKGSVVDVGFAPIVAAISLGGPIVGALVALVGTTQSRELRHRVPWYGVVANHSAMTAQVIISAYALSLFRLSSVLVVDFIATVLAACVLFTLNILITAAFVSVREGQSMTKLVRADAGAYLNMLALAPVAWLMAQMYVVAGWWAVLLFAVPLYTTRLAYQRFVEVREMFTETVRSLAEAVDKRDTFTSGHSQRVQKIAMEIGKVMRVSDDELEALEWGGLLHDIGKIGVPDSVLLKQERLTRDERMTMNAHPVLGAEIIAPVHRLAPEIPIIRHHHEWFNGSGYPDRLAADEIPKLARILHVADAFEAMTAARPYRMTPLTPEQALAELRKFGGIQFDPDVVDAFVKTSWVIDVPDPGRPEVRDVPLIGQAAGQMAISARPTAETPVAPATPAATFGAGTGESTTPHPAIA
ncbi:MAG TPA: HD-GYP domain-containing protein [Candidatus Limnocylindrales bacterium]